MCSRVQAYCRSFVSSAGDEAASLHHAVLYALSWDFIEIFETSILCKIINATT
jgi:hypothetical protein